MEIRLFVNNRINLIWIIINNCYFSNLINDLTSLRLIEFVRMWIIVALIACSVSKVIALPERREVKNILLINSYHHGYAWTDSISSGIIKTVKSHPEYNLFIENLNSKQFGKSRFETDKNHFQEKYSGFHFDGVIVTDNDALDFSLLYDQELYPDVPVVFAGISNPEEYPFEGTLYYGLKESANDVLAIDFIRKLIPNAKKLLVLTDQTTTGKIHRKEFRKSVNDLINFEVEIPQTIDLDSIFRKVSINNQYDAVFYMGIGQDNHGNIVDFIALGDTLIKLSKAPVFTNNILFLGLGDVGGLYQSGIKHGTEAANLLLGLMDSTKSRPVNRIETTDVNYFLDWRILEKYHIQSGKYPEETLIINQKVLFSRENFGVLIIVLVLLIHAILILSIVNRKRRNKQKRSDNQLRDIETQKIELEEAHKQLRRVISELENANDRLKESNISILEAKKRAEESDNLKSAFLANVSHEIRTPLNSIVGFSSLLIEPDLDDETKKTYADLIESNTESLLVLIDEIIDLSKIEAQQLTLKMQDFSIDMLIAELVQVFSHGYKNSRAELRSGKISETAELFIFSDRVRVKQVFINLLTNAFKFTDSGFIEMGYFFSENKEVILYVKDTGIGIHKDHHQAIFHRFRKLNENAAKIYRGTGLGLAITQKLVELLGGKIWIESEPGQGSTFFFTLRDCVLKEIRRK